MIKKTVCLFASTFILSCNGQNTNKKDMLDIEHLKKNGEISYVSYKGAVSTNTDSQSSGVKHYEFSEIKDGKKVKIEGDEELGYYKIVENNDFIESTEYDKFGIPLEKLKTSIFGFIISEIKYDSRGNVSQEIDYESLFNFKSDDLFNFMRINGFTLDKKHYKEISNSETPTPKVLRGYSDDYKFLIPELKLNNRLIWLLLNVKGKYKNEEGIYLICIDGTTGKELLVKKYLGKKSGKNGIGTYANYETIFPK